MDIALRKLCEILEIIPHKKKFFYTPYERKEAIYLCFLVYNEAIEEQSKNHQRSVVLTSGGKMNDIIYICLLFKCLYEYFSYIHVELILSLFKRALTENISRRQSIARAWGIRNKINIAGNARIKEFTYPPQGIPKNERVLLKIYIFNFFNFSATKKCFL